jgi:HD-GYP domain-containing protein (c-di-GMP phosphodiesterase class II)
MAFIDDARTAETDYELHSRIAAAMCSAAINIQAEDGATANHTERSTFALAILADPMGMAKKHALAVCTGGAIIHESTDQQLSDRMGGIWNALCVQG